jgi:hypothetical protein
VTTTRISADHPDLSPVLGPLAEEQRARVVELLDAADARLSSVAGTLAARSGLEWTNDGVVLALADSGQTSIDVMIEESSGKITFAAQLRPGNFFPTEAGMWQPGKPPLRMATDAWDVEGSVAIRFRTRVAGRPYTIQQQVVELPEQRNEDPVGAVEAFAALCGELAELALSREASVEAWRPEEPGGDAPATTTPAASI